MKYTNRTVTTIAFEAADLARYKAAALRMGLDFNAWIALACKAYALEISNKKNRGE